MFRFLFALFALASSSATISRGFPLVARLQGSLASIILIRDVTTRNNPSTMSVKLAEEAKLNSSVAMPFDAGSAACDT
jgi:hypothetical protein